MNHALIERSGRVLLILIFFIISIGGLVQIVPLFTNESTVEVVDTVRPYTPLELVGQDIFRHEGCMACHSQMICPFRDEVDRYGHYSIAAESQYDHPFYWAPSAPGRTWRGSAASIRTNGTSPTCAIRAAWRRNR